MHAQLIRTCLLAWMVSAAPVMASTQVVVGTASAEGILSWDTKSFVGETLYSVVQHGARAAIRAGCLVAGPSVFSVGSSAVSFSPGGFGPAGPAPKGSIAGSLSFPGSKVGSA